MMGDDLKTWWQTPEHERVAALIRDIGVWRLAAHDGCTCGAFCIRNVKVEVGCGKGGDRGIWISSRSLDYWLTGSEDDSDPALLAPIGAEIKRQIEAADRRGEAPVHYHPRPQKDRSDRQITAKDRS